MSKLGQKEAVIKEVLFQLPYFNKYVDNAILLLSSQQLEDIKSRVYHDIVNGLIEYSKPVTNHSEVRSYARSMVMNHLKKAKELNGGHSYTSNNSSSSDSVPRTIRVKEKIYPKGVDGSLLPEELQEFVKKLM